MNINMFLGLWPGLISILFSKLRERELLGYSLLVVG